MLLFRGIILLLLMKEIHSLVTSNWILFNSPDPKIFETTRLNTLKKIKNTHNKMNV